MIDPRLWANSPGMGRAPLLPDPAQPVGAVSSPMADIVRRLRGGDNRTRPEDMPVGALVRDPASMSQAQQIAEMLALGGFPEEGGNFAARAPGAAMGVAAGMAGAPVPGLGTALGALGNQGVQNRRQELAGALTQGMAAAMERGTQARESGMHQQNIAQRARQAPTAVDAYEAGRQAARGSYQPEREQRGGGDSRPSRGGGGNQARDSYAI